MRLILLVVILAMPTTESIAQLLVAHRGASADAPENTLAAFRLAWKQKADAIEGDFYVSADGHIVCIHDNTTKRTGDKNINVGQSSLVQLNAVDVGKWKNARYAGERIPTLPQVMATVPPGKKLFLEVKCGPEIIPHLQRALAAGTINAKNVVVIAFDEKVISGVSRLLPELPAMLLINFKQSKSTRHWTPDTPGILLRLKQTGADGMDCRASLGALSRDGIAKLRAAGHELHCWTVDDVKTARALRALGFDSITTNVPGKLRAELAR